MDRLLSLKLRTATDLDVETIEKKDLYEEKIVKLESTEKIIEISVPGDDKSPQPNAPTLKEVKKKKDVIEVKYLSLEEIEKLQKRLPPFEISGQVGDFFGRLSTKKPLPEGKKVKISFPPKDQMKLSEKIEKQKKKVELLVTSFSPVGRIRCKTRPLKVTFSQPMYKTKLKPQHTKEERLKELQHQASKISQMIIVSPELPKKGNWQWDTPTTAVFYPNTKHGDSGIYLGSTEYSIVIPKGVKALEGCELKESVSFKFSTELLRINKFCPGGIYPPMSTKKPIFGLEFNEKVNPKVILPKISMKKSGILQKKLKLSLLEKEEVLKRINNGTFYKTRRNTNADPMYCLKPCDKRKKQITKTIGEGEYRKTIKTFEYECHGFGDNIVFFTSNDRLDSDKQYNINVDKGAKSLEGNLLSEASFSYTMKTMANLAKAWSNVPNEIYEYDKVDWSIQFNNYLNPEEYEKNRQNWIKLENLSNATVWIEQDKLRIKGRVRKQVKNVSIRLCKVIEDVYFSVLGKEEVIKVKVNERKFHVTSDCSGKQRCLDNVAWCINFNYAINKKHFMAHKDELVICEPKLKFQNILCRGSSSILIQGNPIGKKTFVITVKKHLQCVYETEMKKDHVVKCKIQKEPSFITAQHKGRMIIHDCTNTAIPVSFRFTVKNIEKLRTIIYQVDPMKDYHKVPFGKFGRRVNFSVGKKKEVTVYERVGLDKKKIVFDEEKDTGVGFNEKKDVVMSLEKYLQHPKERIGHLFVVVVNPLDLRNSFFCWIQSTKLSFEAIFSQDKSVTLIANSLEDGKLISKPEFNFAFYKKKKYIKNDFLKGLKRVERFSYYEYDICKRDVVGEEDGIATFDMEKEKLKFFRPTWNDNVKNREDYFQANMIVLKKGNDTCFQKDFNCTSVEQQAQKNRLIPFVFDDKHIFKPKELIKIKGILRLLTFNDKKRRLLFFKKNFPIKYECFDGNGVKFKEGDLKVNELSSFFFEFKIPDNINLGECKIHFKVDEEKEKKLDLILNKEFFHYFKLEEFKEPEFDTSCTVFPKTYTVDDKAIVTSKASYYSGGPLSDCNVKWIVNQKFENSFKPPGRNFSKFNFALEQRLRRKAYPSYVDYSNQPKSTYSFSDKTGDSGEHKLLLELRNPLPFERNKQSHIPKQSYNLKLRTKMKTLRGRNVILPMLNEKCKDVFSPIKIDCKAEVRDLNQNVLTCQNKFVCHPCMLYVGMRKKNNNPIYSGNNAEFQFVVTDPSGNVQEGVNVAIEIFRYNEKKKDIQFVTKKEVKDLSVQIYEEWKTGTFTFVATVIDRKNAKNCSSITFNVQEAPFSVKSDHDIDEMLNRLQIDYPLNYMEESVRLDDVKIILNKPLHFVNEEIPVLIKSPIVGEGVCFVLSNKILWRAKFSIPDSNKKEIMLKVKISEEFVPNAKIYAYVLGHQARKDINDFEITEKDEKGIMDIPAHAKGVVDIRISPKHFELNVTAETTESTLPPGSEAEIKIQVSKGKSIATVLVIDESVLAVTNYKLDFPIETFYPDNNIKVMEYFMRRNLFIRKWKANLDKIKKEKEKLIKLKKSRREEREKKLLARKRREEERKRKEEEERRKKQEIERKLRAEKNKQMLRDQKFENSRSSALSPQFGRMRPPPRKPMSGRRGGRGRGRGGGGGWGGRGGRIGGIRDDFYAPPRRAPRQLMKAKKSRKKGLAFPKLSLGINFKKMKKFRALDDCDILLSEQMAAPTMAKRSFAPPPSIDYGSLSGVQIEYDEDEEEGEIETEDTSPLQMRKLFESTVVFANSIQTDALGKATLKFTLPDNLTRYKIWTIAELEEKYFGFSESSFVAKLPFSLRPAFPGYLNFGDKAHLGFLLSNQTDSTIKVKVALRVTPNLKILDDGKTGYIVVLPRYKRKEITVPVMGAYVGTSKVQIAASGSGFNDAIEKEIHVYSPTITSSFVSYGQLNNNNACHIQSITPPNSKDVHTDFGGVEVETSSTIFQSLSDAFIYVYKYMYDNVEQSSSRILSIVSMVDIVAKFKLKGVDDITRMKNVLQTCLTKLANAQYNNNGGFGWWDNKHVVIPYLSIHAAHAVIRARERYPELFIEEKIPIQKKFMKMLKKCKDYCIGISRYFPFNYRKHSTLPLRAGALYVLAHYARLNILTDKEKHTCYKRALKLQREYGDFSDVTNEGIAWLIFAFIQFSKKKKDIQKLDKNVKKLLKVLYKSLEDKKKVAFFDKKRKLFSEREEKLIMIGHSHIRENASILEMLCYITPDDEILPKLAKFLLRAKRFGKWRNTNINSIVLLSLSTYFKIYEKKEPNFKVHTWLKETYCGEIEFKGRETEIKVLHIPMKNIVISPKEAEVIAKKKKEMEELFAKSRIEREKKRKDLKKKEDEELKKKKEEDALKKKNKPLINFTSMSKDKDADDDLAFFSKRIEKRKKILKKVEIEEEKEEDMIAKITNKDLSIVKKGDGRLYYKVSMKYAPKDLKLSAYDFGFSVSRSYTFCGKEKEHKTDVVRDIRTGVIKVKLGSLVRVRIEFKTTVTRYHVALTDYLPACFAVLNPNLKTTVQIPPETEHKYSRKWYNHINYREERVEAFQEELQPGTYFFSFVCRVKHLGMFVARPTECKEMYEEENNGICNTDFVFVVK